MQDNKVTSFYYGNKLDSVRLYVAYYVHKDAESTGTVRWVASRLVEEWGFSSSDASMYAEIMAKNCWRP